MGIHSERNLTCVLINNLQTRLIPMPVLQTRAVFGPLVATLVDNQDLWPVLRHLYHGVWRCARKQLPVEEQSATSGSGSDAERSSDASDAEGSGEVSEPDGADGAAAADDAEDAQAGPDSVHGSQAAEGDDGSDSDVAGRTAGERACYQYLMLLLRCPDGPAAQQHRELSTLKRFLLDTLSHCADESRWKAASEDGTEDVHNGSEPGPPALLLCASAAAACTGQCDAAALRKAYRAAGPDTDMTETGEAVAAVVRRAAARACIGASLGAGGMCACRGELLCILATEPQTLPQYLMNDDEREEYRNRIFMVAQKGDRSALIARLAVSENEDDEDFDDVSELDCARGTACVTLAAHEQSAGLHLVAQGGSQLPDASVDGAKLGLIHQDAEAISAFTIAAREWVTGLKFESASRNWCMQRASSTSYRATAHAILDDGVAKQYRWWNTETQMAEYVVCALCSIRGT